MLFCSNSAHFPEIQLVCDGPTDGPTDGRTDGRTDTPSYRDARTHLIKDNWPTDEHGMHLDGALKSCISFLPLRNAYLSIMPCPFEISEDEDLKNNKVSTTI